MQEDVEALIRVGVNNGCAFSKQEFLVTRTSGSDDPPEDFSPIFLDHSLMFKQLRTDKMVVPSRLRGIFGDHHELKEVFNALRQMGDEIPVTVQNDPEFPRALSFIRKVKERFLYDEQHYWSFIRVLVEYHNQEKSVSSVNQTIQKILMLLVGHRDLVVEFLTFVPMNLRQ